MSKLKLAPRGKKGMFASFNGISRTRRYVKRAMVVVFMAVGALLTSTVLTSSPALAYPDVPADMHTTKFYSGSICVRSTLNSSYYPVAAIAQQWNVAVNAGDPALPLRLDFNTSCPSTSLTVGVFNNPNHGACLAFTNTTDFPFGDGSTMSYWQYGPGVYINVGIPGCVSTAQRRAHQVAAGIGYALGLRIMTTSGYANRIMCTCSIDTLRAPDSTSAHRVWQIYTGYYGG